MQCISGFDHNGKPSSQTGSQCLWIVTQHELKGKKKGDWIEKWYTLYLLQVVIHKLINKFTLLSDCALYFPHYGQLLPSNDIKATNMCRVTSLRLYQECIKIMYHPYSKYNIWRYWRFNQCTTNTTNNKLHNNATRTIIHCYDAPSMHTALGYHTVLCIQEDSQEKLVHKLKNRY